MVLQLQHAAGNQAVLRLVHSTQSGPWSRRPSPRLLAKMDARREDDDESTDTSSRDLLQRTGEESSWDTRAGQARAFQAAGDTAQALPLYRALLAEVVNALPRGRYPASLTAPPHGSPAPASVTPDMMHVELGNQPGAAITYPSEVQLSRGDPAQLWNWIHFHQESVGASRDYANSLVIHEMQHAGDMVSAYHTWFQQSPTTRGDWLDYWEEWKRQRPMRHLEIYEAQAAESNFANWTDDQKLDWIAGVLVNIPGGLPRGASIPGQITLVEFYRTTAPPDLKTRIVTLFFDTLFGDARRSTMPDQRVSILRNFSPIIADMIAQRREEVRQGVRILEQVLRIRI